MMVERRVKENSLTYLEALSELCDQEGIDEGEVPKLILSSIKEKVWAEAIEYNHVKGGNTLPI